MKSIHLAVALLSGASALTIASLACAQTASGPDASSEIVVTGSRIIKNGNNSPTPVTVVQTEELTELSPGSITDALSDLPVFQGDRGQFSQPNTTGLYGGGAPASSQLNLRNLGPQRTLILFDGQRVPPTNAIGAVDVDMVPQMLIQRVDVVTGGVSAVYGSDAVVGVVNYVTDKNFNGVKAEGNYGISSRRDDESWKAGVAAGARFGNDAGHIEGSYNHYSDKGIPRRNMRPYYQDAVLGATPGSTAPSGSAANPYEFFDDVRSSNSTFGGLITNGPLKNQTFDQNGILSPFVNGVATGTNNSQIGGDGSYGGTNSLKAGQVFDQLFLRIDYRFNDMLNFHTEAAANRKLATTWGGGANLNTYTYSATNAFLPAAYQAQMAAAKATSFTMSKSTVMEAPSVPQVSIESQFFINAGFDGKLGKYSWGVDLNYGDNKINDTFYGNTNFQRLAASLDAVTNPANGQVVCNASLTNAAYSNCVPFNAFGPTSANPAVFNYITGTTHLTPEFKSTEINGQISGDLFNLPAGAVTVALSGEWRKQSFTQGSDASATTLADCTGLRFNCTQGTTALWANGFTPSAEVSQSVKEGAVEVDIPIVKDVPFFQALNLSGALRYTSYDFGGDATTWKLGAVWRVNDETTVRATVSRDIEAPALSQLFQPLLAARVGNQDRLTLQNPSVFIYNIGNPNLVSEIGHTTLVGFVWRPHFVPGFSLSVDAYDIKIDGALTQLQGYNPQLQDICYASKGTSYYCTLQARPLGNFTNTTAANAVTSWTAIFGNISSLEAYGADIEMDYATRLFDRALSARVFTTWQPHYIVKQPGAPDYDEANVAFPNLVPLQAIPAVRVTATVNYSVTDKFTIGITELYRPQMKISAVPTDVYVNDGIDPLAITNLNFDYKIGKTGNDVYFNIRNLLDSLPQKAVGLASNSGYPLIDDATGRYFTVGFRARF